MPVSGPDDARWAEVPKFTDEDVEAMRIHLGLTDDDPRDD